MLWRVGGEFGNAISVGGSTACGEKFPAGAGDHLRPKTKEGTFFVQKEGGFGAFSVS